MENNTNIIEHALIIDVATLAFLSDIENDKLDSTFLNSRYDSETMYNMATHYLNKVNNFNHLKEYLLFLEKLIVFDVLIFDKNAADTVNADLTSKFEQFTRGIDIPYSSVIKSVEQTIDNFENEEATPEIKNLMKLIKDGGSNDPFWCPWEKELHDKFEQNHIGNIPFDFARSDNSLARALFYIEYSRMFNTPCSLSFGKREWLSTFREALKPTVHEILQKITDETILKAFKDSLEPGPDLPESPVVDLIIKKSIKQQKTLSSVAIEIRQSKEAQDYRKLLATIFNQYKGREGIFEDNNILLDLQNIVNLWIETMDTRMGVTRKKRILKLDKLPIIGNVLGFAGMAEHEIKDIILNKPPGYLGFISSWY